ncbi:hypothetical protein MGN70_012217 [Eutypa lata]|nr:hypothetical protein MGN70_012217 [Eutypa lata]
MAGFPGYLPMDMEIDSPSPSDTGSSSGNSSDMDYSDVVRNFFTSMPRFRFIKNLSPGMVAHPMLFAEHRPDNTLLRRIVVKFASDGFYDDAIEDEIRWLDTLRGSLHIMSSLQVDPGNLYRPMLIMPYAARGDMSGLLDRLELDDGDVTVPNRLLWRFFLCLTRAVVAMAYPPSTVPALQRFNNNMRESIPAGAVVPFDLQHNDLHQGNVLLADITRADPEHDISPILKVGFPALPLNRFWLGKPSTSHQSKSETVFEILTPKLPPLIRYSVLGNRSAIAKNISDIALIIMWLAEKIHYTDWSGGGCPWRYPDPPGGAPGSGLEIDTIANADFADTPVAPDLKALLYRCMAYEAEDRPQLPEVLQACENAVYNLTQASFANLPDGGANESDEALREFGKAFLFDADLNDLTHERKRANSASHTWRNAKRTRRVFSAPI